MRVLTQSERFLLFVTVLYGLMFALVMIVSAGVGALLARGNPQAYIIWCVLSLFVGFLIVQLLFNIQAAWWRREAKLEEAEELTREQAMERSRAQMQDPKFPYNLIDKKV